MPGVVTCEQVLRAVLSAVPIEKIENHDDRDVRPLRPGRDPPVWAEYEETIRQAGLYSGSNRSRNGLLRGGRHEDHILTIQTADSSGMPTSCSRSASAWIEHPARVEGHTDHATPDRRPSSSLESPRAVRLSLARQSGPGGDPPRLPAGRPRTAPESAGIDGTVVVQTQHRPRENDWVLGLADDIPDPGGGGRLGGPGVAGLRAAAHRGQAPPEIRRGAARDPGRARR